MAVGVFWGFALSLILAVFFNWLVHRNTRLDVSSWRDDFDDDDV